MTDELYVPTHPIRFVTAASLFDGHDAAMGTKTPPFSAENGELFAENPALSAQNAEAVHVLIHDAVRPAVSEP